MRKLLLAVVLTFAVVCSYGQGATVLFPPAVNQNGGGLPFATITFCSTPTTIGSTGVCQTPITVFKDQGLTQAYGAIQTDGIGFFPPNAVTATSLWFTPGNNYCFTVTTTNMQSPSTNPCTPFSVSVAPGTSPSFASVTLSSFLKSTETSAPTCLAGFDFIWGDSTAHRMKECDNGGSAVQLVHSGVDVNASDQVTTIHLGGGAAVSAYQGNGAKVQLSTGTTVGGDFGSYDGQGNIVDSGKLAPSGAVVGTTDSQTLTNKTLNGAGSGNAVTLLNTQGRIGAIVGNSADQTVYTFTIPANTIQAGKGFRITAAGFHSTGTASVTYKMIVGTTTIQTWSTTSGNRQKIITEVFNNSGVQNSQYALLHTEDLGAAGATLASQGVAVAENFANAVTVKLTFNVANTDQFTPEFWLVELIQ